MTLTVLDHAVLDDRMARLRDAATPPAEFRRLLGEIGLFLTIAATRDLPRATRRITTPMTVMDHPALAAPEPVLVAVLRAGLGLLDGARMVLPDAPIGHIGLARDEQTLRPSEYVVRLPQDLPARGALLLDPMLATGGSAVAAIARLKRAGAPWVRFLCVVAAPEGIAALAAAHPDVPIWTAARDERLNEHGFIIPGLGDAGDRCFGTV